MKKIAILLLVLVSMVSVFGQEIPWGASREEVVPEYTCVERGKGFEYEMLNFIFDSDRKLDDIHHWLRYDTKVRALSQFFKLLEELTEKHGEPEIIKDKYNETWKWETEKTDIRLEVKEETVILEYSQR